MRMLNDYMRLTKSYLKSYVYYQQALENIAQGIKEKEMELNSEPVKITNYGKDMGGVPSELNSTELAADRRILLEREKTAMLQDFKRLKNHVAKLNKAISLLPEDERQAIELYYVQRVRYDSMAKTLYCSERWCKAKVNKGLRSISLMLFGIKAYDTVSFIQSN